MVILACDISYGNYYFLLSLLKTNHFKSTKDRFTALQIILEIVSRYSHSLNAFLGIQTMFSGYKIFC